MEMRASSRLNVPVLAMLSLSPLTHAAVNVVTPNDGGDDDGDGGGNTNPLLLLVMVLAGSLARRYNRSFTR